jgi:DHA2 family multidrug resistance protein
MGLGMGFLFISLTTTTLSGIPKEEMGNATAIFNLLRNLGGSFGVAFTTTLLAIRAQFHQVHLVEHLTPFGMNLQRALPQISQLLQEKGFNPSLSTQGSLGLIQQQLLREASMLSFNDCFHLLSVMMILILPLVLLMKRGANAPPLPGIH